MHSQGDERFLCHITAEDSKMERWSGVKTDFSQILVRKEERR